MPLKIDNFSNSILKNISFELDRGENLIILGSNGVGKTTLAKILTGIIPSNSVLIDGINPSKVFGEKRAKRINYIPPKLEVFDSFISVYDFLALSTFDSSLTIEDSLSTLNITELKDKPCHALSSGESQLLLIASALLHHADYSIFDEPTANLDPQKMQMLFTVLQEALPHKSKIIITHHLDFAYQLGFDILFLEEGHIGFYGCSEDFFETTHLSKRYQGSVIKEDKYIRVKL